MPILQRDLPGILSNGAELSKTLLASWLKGELNKQEVGTNLETEKGKQDISVETLKKLKDSGMVPEGGSIKAGDVASGGDPSIKFIQQNQKAEEQAMQGAGKMYNSRASKLQDVAKGIVEGLNIVSDPNNISTAGAAKTLLIKSFGMNRYNQQEGDALVGNGTFGKVAGLLNSLGDDKNPLSDTQKRSVLSTLSEGLRGVKEQHDLSKSGALQQYNMSRYSDPSRSQMLQSSLGKPFDDYLAKHMQNLPQNASANDTGQMARATPQTPNSGIMDKLASWLRGGLSPTQRTPQPQSLQQPQVPSQPVSNPSLGTPQAASPQLPQAPQQVQMLKVKHKASGQTGSLPANEFDPSQYEMIQ